MKVLSIASALKAGKYIQTDVGQFDFVKQIGQGGNSYVFHFKKGESDFAIKFLLSDGGDKEARFKDEYFCANLIPPCPHIAKAYHFDVVVIDNCPYFCVVMPLYKGHLTRPTADDISAEHVAEAAWNLFSHVAEGLRHLHDSNVLHRDIKPQNVFISEDGKRYIVGDLGIAKFDSHAFPREAESEVGDRLANYKFSAPEQSESGVELTPACDIYALGQLLHWYMTGQVVKGVGRTRFSNADSPKKVVLLDEIVERCVSNEAAHRFQSVGSIYEYIEKRKVRDPWDAIRRLDGCIRRSFPKIRDIVSTSDPRNIGRFLAHFSDGIHREDYWFMSLEGGDNECGPITEVDSGRWLLGEVEVEVDALIVCRHQSIYKNVFVLLVRPSAPFLLVDSSGRAIARTFSGDESIDVGILRPDGQYIEESEVANGYYDDGSNIIVAHPADYRIRVRHLVPYAYIVGVRGTVLNEGPREITTEFLADVLAAGSISAGRLKQYFAAGRPYLAQSILAYA